MTAPALSSGSLPLPHLGDCTHDGQPVRHSHDVDRLAGRAQPVGERVVAALGEPGAAGVPVVDEDRRPAGVRVQGGRHPADVPAVAGGEQRQQPDRGVLGGVRRARHVGATSRPTSSSASCGERVPDGRGAQLARGQVQRGLVDELAGADPPPQVAHHLVA